MNTLDKELVLSEAIAHVYRNVVLTGQGLKCVDGRDTEQSYMMAQPGAVLGDVLALIAWAKINEYGWTPGQIVDKVFAAARKVDGGLYFHTDENSSLTSIKGKDIVVVTLKGEHKERGVLVVMGKQYTIRSFDPEQDSMYFVFNKTLAEERKRKIVKAMGIDGSTYQDLGNIYEKQLSVTLGLLAGGLPIFEVNADTNVPTVQYKGLIEKVKVSSEEDHHGIIGCGHFAKVAQHPELYGVNEEKVVKTLNYIKGKITS